MSFGIKYKIVSHVMTRLYYVQYVNLHVNVYQIYTSNLKEMFGLPGT